MSERVGWDHFKVGKLYKWKMDYSWKSELLPPPHRDYTGTFVRKHRQRFDMRGPELGVLVFTVNGNEMNVSPSNRIYLVPQHPASKEIKETPRKVPSLENAAKLRLSTAEMAAVREYIPGHRKEGGTRKRNRKNGTKRSRWIYI